LAIRTLLVDKKILAGVISMPGNIFATTGTSVSVLFIDKSSINKAPVLVDASNLGTNVKEGKNQRTLLSSEDENLIINSFLKKSNVDNFLATPSFREISEKNYSLSAGMYFDVSVSYSNQTPEEFKANHSERVRLLEGLFVESTKVEKEIVKVLKGLSYEEN